MKNLLRIFVLSTVIWSCNNSDVEVKRLEKENKVLRDSLLMLKKPQPNYINSVRTFTTKNEIKLGEEWTAEVCLSVVEDKNPPRVILCNIKNEDYIPTGDTIPWNDYYQTWIYRVTPKDTGTFVLAGKLQLKTEDDIREYPFKRLYHVKR